MSISHTETLLATEKDEDLRLDVFLFQSFPEYSRSYFQLLLENEAVLVNGKKVKKREKIECGDLIEVVFHEKELPKAIPEDIPLDIIFEDDELLAINKPRGLVVHPAPGHFGGTVVNALLYRYKELLTQTSLRPGIIHRLDKDTSGVLLIAKTARALEAMSQAFKDREVEKEYVAICIGNPGTKTITNTLGRDSKNRQKFTVTEKGKPASSEIETVDYFQGYSWVRILPFTGRTHQIRVHLSHLGCPILGDPIYGNIKINQKFQLNGQLLHAQSLKFVHPFTLEKIELRAEIPEDMKELKSKLFH